MPVGGSSYPSPPGVSGWACSGTEMTLALLRYTPIVGWHLGPLSISPHGLGTAVGFLAPGGCW
jgi:hypothetical protein